MTSEGCFVTTTLRYSESSALTMSNNSCCCKYTLGIQDKKPQVVYNSFGLSCRLMKHIPRGMICVAWGNPLHGMTPSNKISTFSLLLAD